MQENLTRVCTLDVCPQLARADGARREGRGGATTPHCHMSVLMSMSMVLPSLESGITSAS